MEKLIVLIPALSLLGYCTILARYSHLRIEITPFFVISSTIGLLYIAALLGALPAITNIVLILGSIFFILSPFYLNQGKKKLFQDYLTPGLVILVSFIMVFSLFAYPIHFRHWDEFSHWGPHAKFIYYNNGLMTISQSTIHKSYPPGSALFSYYFFHLTGYSEGVAYVAQTILLFSPLGILLKNFSWNRSTNAILFFSLVSLLLVSYLHIDFGANVTIYMDVAVGIFLGMTLVYYFQSQRTALNLLYLIPILFSFMLLKIKITPLALLAICLILLDQVTLLYCEKVKQKMELKQLIKSLFIRVSTVVLLIVTLFTVKLSWQHYLTNMHLRAERKFHLSLTSLANTFFFHVSVKEKLVLHAFAQQFIKTLPELTVLLVLIGLSIIANKRERRQRLFIHFYMLVGFAAYLFGLLLLYSYAFIEREAVRVASFNRYLSIYYTAWFLLTLSDYALIFQEFSWFNVKKLKPLFLLLTIISVMSALHIDPIRYFKDKITGKHKPYYRTMSYLRQQVIRKITNAVKKTIPINHKILIVWQNTPGMEREMLIYELVPWSSYFPSYFSYGNRIANSNSWSYDINLNDFKVLVGHSDYLLVAYAGNNFWKHYGPVFDSLPPMIPLITYSICLLPNYSSVNKRGCVLTKENAYLFKVIKTHGHLALQNVVAKEKRDFK